LERKQNDMNKVAIVYWSGTGNTEVMAACIASGVEAAGGEAVLLNPGEFTASRFSEFGVVAFGCPAMGSEVLEEMEFEPMFSEIEGSLSGKKIALFGSYGWGDGQWMRDWCERCSSANLYDENGLIANYAPDDAVQEACQELGRNLAAW
jgi:flavodoxin short chain